MVYKNTISLHIWANGKDTKLHITVCSLNCSNKQQYEDILRNVINKFKSYFGSNQPFTLVFKGWLSNNNNNNNQSQSHGNSVATTSFVDKQCGLEKIRKDILDYIKTTYGNIINTDWYADGFPPQHINIKGDENILAVNFGIYDNWINQSTTVTYSIGGN